MRAWLRQLTGDAARADDLAQDTFIRAWEALPRYAERGRLLSWLMKIAFRLYAEQQRRDARRADLAGRFLAPRGAPPGADTVTAGAELPKLLGVLGEEERLVLVLAYGYGLSHAEIAAVADLPVGTVKSHIRRAKQRIRASFDLGACS